MTVDELKEDLNNKKVVIVGIRIDSHSREVLSWALVKVAEPGDCVVAIHVCQSSDHVLSDKPLLDSYLKVYNDLCSVKKIGLTGKILKGKSVREVLVSETKKWGAVALVLGTSNQCTLGKWGYTAKYCAKKLPPTTNVLAINNGKIVFRRSNSNQLPGLLGDPRPSVTSKGSASELGDFASETETETVKSTSDQMTSSSQDGSSSSLGSEDFKNYIVSFVHKQEKILISRSTSLVADQDIMDQSRGWPLLRRATSAIPQTQNARDMSVVQWVMSLPDRSPRKSPESFSPRENTLDREISDISDQGLKNNLSALVEVPESFEDLLETSSCDCQWFSLEVLKACTSHFCTENLIGKGGSNYVFKGNLPDGKKVAVKTTKSTRETWKDFAYEVKIVSSLKHKNIVPLLGICVEDSDKLISIYDFFPKGSLEEYLHGKKKDKFVFPWEVRFNIAVGIAEALNYLHKECPEPVIHRDVKSSNILLSDGFEPKLSDFGLALLGPTASSFMTEGDVVGTFGYIAPEYFMYGKVSDKIDVYAFGVVLLELLSGRRPIGYDTPKGQESLVMWAKPKIENGDVKGILDPNLDGNFDEVQMQRIVFAANLCITRSSRLRPNINQILKLLKGEIDIEKWVKSQSVYLENQDCNDDEVYPSSSAELHLGVAMVDVEDDTTSFSSVDQSNINIHIEEEYLNGRWSRSSSFD